MDAAITDVFKSAIWTWTAISTILVQLQTYVMMPSRMVQVLKESECGGLIQKIGT